jgi:hypothetical protein
MTDLVERLRNKNLLWTVPGAFREESASEIERLRAEIEHLRTIPADHPYHEVWKEVLYLRAEIERLRGQIRIPGRRVSGLARTLTKARAPIVGRVSGKIREGDQVPGMPHAICHACGLGYKCSDVDCPNDKPNPMWPSANLSP